MNIQRLIGTLATTIALLIAVLGIFFFIRFRSRRWIYLVIVKMLDNSLAPYLALVGAIAVVLGIQARAPVAIFAGMIGTVTSIQYVLRVTKSHPGFDQAFGPGWLKKIPTSLGERMLPRRWTWIMPPLNESGSKQEISFWKISGSERQLLCDLWQPSPDIPRSGLGLIYFHGSLWHYSDKDHGARPLFSHLTAQGHVLMDVAYRLCPEVDLWGMLDDVKRAIAWMKANAGRFGIDPGKIALAGGSAGAHLSLLAAYAARDPQYTPSDLGSRDVSVKGLFPIMGRPISVLFCGGIWQGKSSFRERKNSEKSARQSCSRHSRGLSTSVTNLPRQPRLPRYAYFPGIP